MKNLRLFGFATVAALASGALFVVACSDDTETSPTPSDGGPDGQPGDGGIDSPTTDAADTGIDSGTDSGPTAETFAADLGSAMCNTLARCCFGSEDVEAGAPVDGGTFDRAACVSFYAKVGFESSLEGYNVDAGNTVVDHAAASDCLGKIKVLSCDLTGAEFQAARGACFNAVKGTKGAGQACSGRMDCAPGTFCDSRTDAGIGLCAPLVGADAGCGTFDTGDVDKDLVASDQACSWRGSGDTMLFCYQGDDPTPLPKDEWKCTSARAEGEPCFSSLWCATGICNPLDSTCTSPLGVFPQAFCSVYVNP